MEEKNEKFASDGEMHIPVSEKAENFWYHYKWHTIVAIFLLIVGTILILQLCTKTEYDAHILYAGEKIISSSSLSGDGNSEYLNLVGLLESVADDCNNDGNVNLNLQNLHILSNSEYEEAVKDIQDPMQKASLESEIQTNTDTLYNSLMFGDYYLCLLSEDIFLDYEERFDTSVFAPLSEYVKEGAEYSYIGERGIYLSSLAIYSDPAVSILPEDTVVCIRLPGVLGARDDGKAYAASESLLRAILAYGE